MTDKVRKVLQKIDTRWWAIVLVGVISVGVLLAALWWPLASTVVQIVRHDANPTWHGLYQGEELVQTFRLEEGFYSGVRFLVQEGTLQGRQVEAVISRGDGHVLAEGRDLRLSFREADNSIVVDVLTPWWEVQSGGEMVQVTLRLVEGNVLPVLLVGGEEDVYRAGQLLLDGRVSSYDLYLAVVQRTTLSDGAWQGVLGGLAILIGALLLFWIPKSTYKWGVVVGLVVLATPLAIGGYWFSPDVLGIADWDYYFSLHQNYRDILVTHQEFPLWNPYTCGGTAGLADPEFPGFTLTFLLELLFGIPAGVRLAIFLATAVGGVGMVMLAKRLKISPEGALVVGLAFAFGSVNLLEITEGHVNVFAAMWIPWVFWSWLGVYRKTVLSVVCGIFLALTFLQGGIYLLMYTLLAFALLPWIVSKPKEAIRATFLSGLWALGFAAIKLIPVLLWLRQFPDEAYASSAYTLPWLTDIFFGRYLHGETIVFRQGSGWHEYGAYIGYFVFGLALLGVSQIRKSRVVRGLLVAAVMATLLSTAGPALQPFFDEMPFLPRSNISRVILFAVIPIVLLAGFGVDQLRRRLPGGRIVALVITGLVAIDLLSVSYPLSLQAFTLPDVYPPPVSASYPIAFTSARFDTRGVGNRTTRAYAATRRGFGSMTYCSVLGPSPGVRTIEDEDGQAYLGVAEGKTADIRLEEWSPSEVTVRVRAEEDVRVDINTNHVAGWLANDEPATVVDNRVAALVPAGEHVVVFRYVTPGLYVGAAITLGTLFVALLRHTAILSLGRRLAKVVRRYYVI